MQRKQLNWSQRGQLWLRLFIRVVGTGLILWAIAAVGRPLLSLFMPFLLALAAAALLDHIVRVLQKRLGWARKWVSLIVLIVLVGGIGGALALLVRAGVDEVISLAENWDGLLAAFSQGLEKTEQLLQNVMQKLPFELPGRDQPLLDQVGQWLSQWLTGMVPDIGNLTGFAAARARGVVGFVLALVAFLMGAYFLCADYPYLRTGFARRLEEDTLARLRQVKKVSLGAFGGYLRAQLLLSLGVFVILLCGFLITGQSYALLLALGFAMMDFIPLIGSGTVMVPWAVINLFLGNYARAIEMMIIWGLIVVFRRLAEPKVVGDQTGLSPILSLISIYVGMRLYGVLGMVFCPILVLVVLNLAGLGLFDGTRNDLKLAFEDILAILRGSRDDSL
jgi:sporulation integral membrane protein YtvI